MKKNALPMIILLAAALIWPLKAYVMSSPSYRLDFDSINVGGGYSDSMSYESESTVGEIATGDSQSGTYNLHAGYQQMNEVFISISLENTVAMSPAIMPISGGTADGAGDIAVVTDNPAGYQLTLKAATSPAMAGAGDDFQDYSPAGAPVPDYSWSIGASDSEFGFTSLGSDADRLYRNNGGVCNQLGGAADGNHCWNGFLGSNPVVAAQSFSANHPAGNTTTVNYRAQVKANSSQTPGNYSASITATVTAK